MNRLLRSWALALLGGTMLLGAPAAAADLVIKDHVFTPTEIKVPAGKIVELIVDNQDVTPEEFESPALKVEKVIPGKSTGKVRFGPLAAGSYLFIGEFNQKTARGVVTAE